MRVQQSKLRYSKSRQKACDQCCAIKLRCERRPASCKRCLDRGIECSFSKAREFKAASSRQWDSEASERPVNTVQSASKPVEPVVAEWMFDSQYSRTNSQHTGRIVSATNYISSAEPVNPNGSERHLAASIKIDKLDFRDLRLCCPIRAHEISNRWLNNFIPEPHQRTKTLSSPLTGFLTRIMRSYSTTLVHDRQIPPFIHHVQLSSEAESMPLIACMSIVPILQHPRAGAKKDLSGIIMRNMESIDEEFIISGKLTLATFQSYLIYTMALYFEIDNEHILLSQMMMTLQNMAAVCFGQGIVCEAEMHNLRPRWESWIIAEASRRSLYVMYLFDNMLSARSGIPTTLAVELTTLPAPASKLLWQAQTRSEWEQHYNIHIAKWPSGGLRIEELWPIPDDFDPNQVEILRRRIEKWLVNLDEFGTMLYAITSCTHGS